MVLRGSPFSAARSFALTPNKITGLINSYLICAVSLRCGRIRDHPWVGSWRSYLRLGMALLSGQHTCRDAKLGYPLFASYPERCCPDKVFSPMGRKGMCQA